MDLSDLAPQRFDLGGVFAAELAGGPTRRLPSAAVRDLLVVEHAPAQVAAYRLAMSGGARFPPPAVVRLLGRYLLADGHKRLAAWRDLAAELAPPAPVVLVPDVLVPDVLVEVWPWRRWLADQARQAAGNVRKNLRIVRLLGRDPAAALALAGTTLAHWRRVGRSLALLARRGRPGRGRPGSVA